MRLVCIAMFAVGCGRIGFTPVTDLDGSPTDAEMLDAGPSVLGVYQAPGADWGRAAGTLSDGDYVLAAQFASPFDVAGMPLPYSAAVDAFVMRIAPTGGLRWVRTLNGSSGETPINMTVDGEDNIYVSGNLDGDGTCGGVQLGATGTVHGFVCSWDKNGNPRWSLGIGGSDPAIGPPDVAFDVAVFGTEAVIVGSVQGSVDFGSGTPTPPVGPGLGDAYVLVVDSATGAFRRVTRYGSTMDASIRYVEYDGTTIYLVGRFSGNVTLGPTYNSQGMRDAFVLAVDPSFTYRWSLPFGGPGDEFPVGAALDADGLYVVGWITQPVSFGSVPLTPVGSQDAFAGSLTLDGQTRWARTLGASGCARYNGPQVRAGTLLVGGTFQGAATFAGTALTGGTDEDGFVVRYSTGGSEIGATVHPTSGSDATSAVADSGQSTVLGVGYRNGADSACGATSVFVERDIELVLLPSP